jgi:hypothetical protein
MNAKRATLRLYVAVTGLFASVFELAGATVRLATALLERATRYVSSKRATTVPEVIQVPPAVYQTPHAAPHGVYQTSKTTEVTTEAWAATAPVGAPVAMPQNERLHSALVNMGFKASCVRKFTASVQGRNDPLETLVKEGLVALSSN